MAESSLPLETRLLNIKDFSDFTLGCHGRKFGLHKAILCAQSSVMANTLRGDSEEATASLLHVPFDIESISRLLEFMYTGDYQLSPDPALELLLLGELDDSDEEVVLSALSRSKVDDILVHEWSTDAFCGLIQESLDSTSDQEYYQILAAKAVEHADELVERHIFEKGGVAERLALYMLPILMTSLKAAETRRQELTSNLCLEKTKLEEEDQKLADRSKALEATRPTSYTFLIFSTSILTQNLWASRRVPRVPSSIMGNAESTMSNVVSTNVNLLKSGEYSDLTLVCEGREFRVHKAIICMQSPVIATALKSKFKEAETNTMEVIFPFTAMKRMLHYMYTGDYAVESTEHVSLPQSVQPNPANGSEQLAQSAQITDGEEQPTATTVSEALICHARVNSIADYYDVKGLAKLSANRILKLLSERWSADAFCDLIEAVGSTGDKHLREVIVHAAAVNVSELVRKDIFSEGMVANDIAAEVLKVSTENPTKKENKLKNEVRVGKERIESLEKNLVELASVLSGAPKCPNWSCHKKFGCQILQRPLQNEEKHWMVYCNQCDRPCE
ncbi:hypothetical protein F4782DRAFT_547687 [Xylaria castorea]|nr:hypothetical protein F4782DRAFT_547687 [Xylaria castorea]